MLRACRVAVYRLRISHGLSRIEADPRPVFRLEPPSVVAAPTPVLDPVTVLAGSPLDRPPHVVSLPRGELHPPLVIPRVTPLHELARAQRLAPGRNERPTDLLLELTIVLARARLLPRRRLRPSPRIAHHKPP